MLGAESAAKVLSDIAERLPLRFSSAFLRETLTNGDYITSLAKYLSGSNQAHRRLFCPVPFEDISHLRSLSPHSTWISFSLMTADLQRP